jgi:branched-chain amino acid aminotransferase
MVDTKRIWVDGELVDYEKATTHVLSFTLHYGLGTFEGIRCYKTKSGRLAVFRMNDHVDRLLKSCSAGTIDLPWSHQQICEAIGEVIRDNQYGDCYVRPLVWLGEGSLSVGSTDNVVRMAIAAWPWGAYLGQEALEQGVRVCMSNYSRMSVAANLVKAKIVGQYVNSVLAKRDAKRNGYAEAILLDQQGYVTEGTGENLFVVRKGKIVTPPHGMSILAGITRDTIMELANDLGVPIEEGMLTRSDLFFADEIFFTGTAAEVTPVREIDGRKIGSGARGPITERLQKTFFQTVRGENKKRENWLNYV